MNSWRLYDRRNPRCAVIVSADEWAAPQKANTALNRSGHLEDIAALVAFVAGPARLIFLIPSEPRNLFWVARKKEKGIPRTARNVKRTLRVFRILLDPHMIAYGKMDEEGGNNGANRDRRRRIWRPGGCQDT